MRCLGIPEGNRFNLSQVLLCQHPAGRPDGPDAIDILSDQTKMTKTRNPLAACLSHGAYQPKKVKPAKGKGSFRRQDKHKGSRGY